MTPMIRFFVFAFACLMPFGAVAQSVVPAQMPVQEAPVQAPPVVVELFTSQGCPFCPPADRLLAQLAAQSGVIALSCHVDYFGVRKNALGKSFCTKRQNDYNRLIGTGPRYTPQVVINGTMDMIGSEGGKISAAILRARAEKIMDVNITSAGDGIYSFSLPKTALAGQPVRIWMAVYDKPVDVAITEGNNLGKTVTYTNVVSTLEDLGAWDGQEVNQSITNPLASGNAGFAILAQNTSTGRIIAAGSVGR